jgi:hypothetical protein
MDRRLFLTGMVGIAAAAGLAGLARPSCVLAGVPQARGGILDELNAPAAAPFEKDETRPEFEPVQYWRRHRRRRRRRVRRRVCRRYWRRGYWRYRCYRRPVWVWY